MIYTLRYKVKNILISFDVEKDDRGKFKIKGHFDLGRLPPQVQQVLYNLVQLMNEEATRAILYNYINKNKNLDHKEIKFFELFISDLFQM